jgi:hypothetical protein
VCVHLCQCLGVRLCLCLSVGVCASVSVCHGVCASQYLSVRGVCGNLSRGVCARVHMCVCLFQGARVCVHVFVYFTAKPNYLHKRMAKNCSFLCTMRKNLRKKQIPVLSPYVFYVH